MAFCNEIPSTVIPDHPNPEFDNANELKGEAYDVPIDPAKLAAMTYPPEAPDPAFNPVIGRA